MRDFGYARAGTAEAAVGTMADPGTSVVNAWGESHEVPGLFIADMSVFPTSLGAPPQLTTAALADRTASHILARWPEFAA